LKLKKLEGNKKNLNFRVKLKRIITLTKKNKKNLKDSRPNCKK
jgi:hypothetical protein